jgi:hypothetical protein
MTSKLFLMLSLIVLGTLPLLGHHPFSAEYDWKKPVTVTGTVTKFDWSNPHSMLYVDAKGTDGKTQTWTFELGGINGLTKAGWAKTTLKAGDLITVDAWQSKSSSTAGNVKSVTLRDGRELSGASSIVMPGMTRTYAQKTS